MVGYTGKKKSPIEKMKSREKTEKVLPKFHLNPKVFCIFMWLQTQITCSLPVSCSAEADPLA